MPRLLREKEKHYHLLYATVICSFCLSKLSLMIQMLLPNFCKVPLGSQNDKLLELKKTFRVTALSHLIDEETEGK